MVAVDAADSFYIWSKANQQQPRLPCKCKTN
jgi:hypothetical protein